MAKTFDLKIKELEQEKSELDLTFLQNLKEENEEKMYEILDNQSDEIDETTAVSHLNKVKLYRKKIKDIDEKIAHNDKFIEDIETKISQYREGKEKTRNIKLYRETQEWITEIFWDCELYQYAKVTNNEDLINKLETRRLTPNEYSAFSEKMYKELFAPILKKKNKKSEVQQAPKTIILLPEWMSEQINEELGWNKDINPKEIEEFLKKELKRNWWEIKLSHINNKFKDKSNQVTQYIKRLIINYPSFVIVDNKSNNVVVTQNQTKREKLISTITSESVEQKNNREKLETLLKELSETSEIQDLGIRISKYIDLFEELWCKFDDKSEFIQKLINVINTHTHAQFDNGIQNVLWKMVQLNLKPEKSEWKWYLSYKLSPSYDARRILAYPNWEIFTICSHDEYEKIINMKPPVEKRRK